MKLLVTGTREQLNFKQQWLVTNLIKSLHEQCLVRGEEFSIVVGDCPSGVDRKVLFYAVDEGVDFQKFEADWNAYGRAAGPIRNKAMVDTNPDLVLGFPLGESRGTRGCMNLARDKHIPVLECDLTDLF